MPLSRTLRQYVAQLKKTELAPDFLDSLLDYHYQMTYADAEKDAATEKQLNQNIRQWKNSSTTGSSS